MDKNEKRPRVVESATTNLRRVADLPSGSRLRKYGRRGKFIAHSGQAIRRVNVWAYNGTDTVELDFHRGPSGPKDREHINVEISRDTMEAIIEAYSQLKAAQRARKADKE